jgi:hypothetical protein
MRPYYGPLGFILLASLVLGVSCSRSAKHREIFWHGELWDGMNRMVFTLEDLGFKIESVDTEKGTIVAGLGPPSKEEPSGRSGGEEGTYRILVQFPKTPDLPIAVSAAQPGTSTADSSRLRKMVSKISKRFAWYAGNRGKVQEGSPPD